MCLALQLAVDIEKLGLNVANSRAIREPVNVLLQVDLSLSPARRSRAIDVSMTPHSRPIRYDQCFVIMPCVQ